jgi:hypothetical protein
MFDGRGRCPSDAVGTIRADARVPVRASVRTWRDPGGMLHAIAGTGTPGSTRRDLPALALIRLEHN